MNRLLQKRLSQYIKINQSQPENRAVTNGDKMRKRDLIFLLTVIFILAVMSGFYFMESTTADSATIYLDSKPYKTVSLSENQEINVNNTNTVVIENGYIFIKSATCPDKLCVKMGKINDSKKDIICLPNNVRIQVFKKSAIDAISG